MPSIKDILSLSTYERKNKYQAEKISSVIIDGVTFEGYRAFSFIWEKSYIKSPIRSGSGAINNLDSYATFLTPHLKIDFSLMSIDDYRNLMELVYSSNEHTVTCYDVVANATTTNKMYFSTEEMPKLWAIARALNGEEWVELLGVEDYTVEMIGTNSDVEEIEITYKLNVPQGVSWNNEYPQEVIVKLPKYLALPVGDSAILTINGTETRISNITFGDKHDFQCWSKSADGTGVKYFDEKSYYFKDNITLYAIWTG